MGEGLDLGGVDVVRDIDAHRLLGKDDRHAELQRYDTRDTDTRCLDGQDLGDLLARIQPLEFLGELGDEADVDLMVDKAVDLQDISFAYDAVPDDSFLE